VGRSIRPRPARGPARAVAADYEGGVIATIVGAGVILLVTGLLILAGASDDMDKRMPSQVLPRRFARYPLTAGAALLIVAGIAAVIP
jgi:hypothetical protein